MFSGLNHPFYYLSMCILNQRTGIMREEKLFFSLCKLSNFKNSFLSLVLLDYWSTEVAVL